MKVFVILAVLIGLGAAQSSRRDPRCPTHPMDARPDIFGDPWNCENYFRCHNGMSIQFTCPNGRHFSERTASCEPAHLAQCRVQGNSPNNPQTGNPNNNNNNVMNCPASDVPGQFIYYAHRQSCQQFYQCSGGRAVLLRCPNGHLWNMERSFCDSERNVRCTTPRF